MKIREIAYSDIPALFEVRIATWHNAHGAEELEKLGITPDKVFHMLQCGSHRGWLCQDGSKVLGFAMGNRETGEMWVIAVLKEYENRGIGRALMAAVEEWLWGEGCEYLWLTTDLDEDFRAVGFYRKLGWIDWKIEGDRYMRKLR